MAGPSQEEIADMIRQDLERLGCKCHNADPQSVRVGESRATGITEHRDDCPAVAHYSRPENQPNG